jgi:DNA adenine methylase
MDAVIRYPGSKAKHVQLLLPEIPTNVTSFAEPFCGTAAVSFGVLRRGGLERLWLNDLDTDIMHLWRTVADPKLSRKLIELIEGYTPTTADFYAWRDDTDELDPLAVRSASSSSTKSHSAGSV